MLTVIIHGFLILIWVLILDRIRLNRLIAISALVLFISGPTLTFWAPLPDSRMLGLLAFLPGWLILTTVKPQTWLAPCVKECTPIFWAGVLFSVSQSLQYTTLYIIIPVLLVYFSYWLITSPRRWGITRLILACVAGCLTIPIIMEVLSAMTGVSVADGPFMTYLERWGAHRAIDTLESPRLIWIKLFELEVGWPLCFLTFVGIITAIYRQKNQYGVEGRTLSLLAIALSLGLLQQFLSGSQAMFRQVSVWLPFFFIFSAIGAHLLASVFPWRRYQIGIALVILALSSITPIRESITVFRAQLGVGQAVAWASAAAHGHQIRWLSIAWFPSGHTGIRSEAALRKLNRDDLLISYYATDPLGVLGFMETNPRVRTALEQIKPLYSHPTLYATNSMWSEIHARGNEDYRNIPLLSDVRVYRIGDILDRLPAQ